MQYRTHVGIEFFDSPFFDADRYLVYYDRHDCPQLNRLSIASRVDLLAFLRDRIRPDRGEGMDLTITTFEMAEFLITNHDGDMWWRRPSDWPDTADA